MLVTRFPFPSVPLPERCYGHSIESFVEMPALAQNASAEARSCVVLKASSSGLRYATPTALPLDRPGKATIGDTFLLTRPTELNQ